MTALMTKAERPKFELMPKASADAFLKLDAASQEVHRTLLDAEINGNQALKTLAMAKSINLLRSLLVPSIVGDLMALMNNPLGFRTDRDPGRKTFNKETKRWEETKPYDEHVVIDVTIQALIRGLRMTGDEVNIIAGNMYVTRNGFERLIYEFPGLKQFKHAVGVPTVAAGQNGETAFVPAKASWILNGAEDSLVCDRAADGPDFRIPVRVNNGMGMDAILGKAESKLYRRVYKRLTGMSLQTEADAGDDSDASLDSKKLPNAKVIGNS